MREKPLIRTFIFSSTTSSILFIHFFSSRYPHHHHHKNIHILITIRDKYKMYMQGNTEPNQTRLVRPLWLNLWNVRSESEPELQNRTRVLCERCVVSYAPLLLLFLTWEFLCFPINPKRFRYTSTTGTYVVIVKLENSFRFLFCSSSSSSGSVTK